jgi:hypothetical protein
MLCTCSFASKIAKEYRFGFGAYQTMMNNRLNLPKKGLRTRQIACVIMPAHCAFRRTQEIFSK